MRLALTARHRAIWLSVFLIATVLVACSSDDPAADATTTTSPEETTTTAPTGPVGPIAFQRGNVEDADIYAVNVDGSNEQRLFEGPAQLGRWSPAGTELAIFCCD